MIVCSCSRITDRDIHLAIAWMRAADPHTLITPGKVYRALGKSAECGGCIRLFIAEMRAEPALEVPSGIDSAAGASAGRGTVPPALRGLRRGAEDAG